MLDTYLGVAVATALGGLVIPIPEEAVLLLVGYGTATGLTTFWPTIVVCWLSLLCSDFIIFSLSRHGSRLLFRVQNRISQTKFHTYEEHMKLHAGKTIFVLRFTPGLRLLSMLLAGSRHIKTRTFIYADALALSIYVPLAIFIGFHFHANLTRIITQVQAVRHALSLIAVLIVGILIVLFVRKRFFTNS